MSEAQRDPTLSEMTAKGMSFMASHPTPGGHTSIAVPAERVPLYCDDPDAFWALHHGVSTHEFRRWIDDGFAVRCSATKSNGGQCRNTVRGGHLVYSPKEWVALQGGYCPVHEVGN